MLYDYRVIIHTFYTGFACVLLKEVPMKCTISDLLCVLNIWLDTKTEAVLSLFFFFSIMIDINRWSTLVTNDIFWLIIKSKALEK